VGDGWRALGKHRHHSTFDTPDGPVFITSEDSAQALSLWRGEEPMAGIGRYEIAQVEGGDDILTVRLFSDDKTARAPLLTAQVEALPAGAALYRQGFCQVLAEPQLGQSVDAKRAHGEDKLTAPMPGKVVQIVKEDGAAVTAGEAVIIMEAMKIEHTLRAPFAGIVALEGVSEGESVSLGALLARIVPDEEEGEALP
jgi:biotin carboxyl carrier protein